MTNKRRVDHLARMFHDMITDRPWDDTPEALHDMLRGGVEAAIRAGIVQDLKMPGYRVGDILEAPDGRRAILTAETDYLPWLLYNREDALWLGDEDVEGWQLVADPSPARTWTVDEVAQLLATDDGIDWEKRAEWERDSYRDDARALRDAGLPITDAREDQS